MKKILFYTSNGLSLGHLQRSFQISQAIKNQDNKVKIGLITSSVKPNIFGRFFDQCFKITPLTDELLKDPYQEARLENANLVLDIFKKYKPDLVVADFLLGSNFTFYPLKCALDQFKIKSIFIWRLGEIKNLIHDFEKEKNKLRYFNKIVLPYDKSELPSLKDSKFEISGPVFKKINKKKLDAYKKKYKITIKNFLITIVLGGGGELRVGNCESPSKIMEIFLRIYVQLKKTIPNLRVIISTGPYYNEEKLKFNSFEKIKVVNFEKNLLELICLSDLIISSAGYNTCQEIIEAKTPAILVPLWRKNKEQFERAQYLEKKGIVKVLENDSSVKFLKLIINCYNNLEEMKKNFRKFSKVKSGNENIAKTILNNV